jgi:TRAP-type uncharacterized transport system substrate-binding protein
MKKSLIVLAALAAASAALAQDAVIASGGATGTYYRMINDMLVQCDGKPLRYRHIEQKDGSLGNLDSLLGKSEPRVDLAMMQSDVLALKQSSEDLSGVRTVYAMFPEEVHFVARKTLQVKKGAKIVGGYTVPGTGNMEPVANVQELVGLRVGAVGGSVVTARVLQFKMKLAYDVVPFTSNEDLKKALDSGNVQAAVVVGGQPAGLVKDLDSNYRLLAVPEALITKDVLDIYRTAQVSYRKMGPESEGVRTVAVDSLLVARNFSSPKMLEGLAGLRACLDAALPAMKDSRDVHGKWEKVQPSNENKGKWRYYDLPAARK